MSELRSIALTASLDVNSNNGVYRNGREYPTEKKVETALVYWRLRGELGKPPSDRRLAMEARVGKTFAAKIKMEIADGGTIWTVEDLKEERWSLRVKGVGSIYLTIFEQ